MSDSSPPSERADAFRALYEAVYPDVLRFVQRRSDVSLAEDVSAEVFVVVWRRFDDVPQGIDDARAWVFGVARNILLNAYRSEQRHEALGVRLASITDTNYVDSHDDSVASRVDLNRAWHCLPEVHQEALGLSILEDLAAPHAAAVLGISPVAFRIRLSRARRALRLLLDHLPASAGPSAPMSERTATS